MQRLIDRPSARSIVGGVARTGDGPSSSSAAWSTPCAARSRCRWPRQRNAGVPPERSIEFRVGIHLGDVVEEADGDLIGDGVNIAARLEAIAAPVAIRLSEQAYWQVKGRPISLWRSRPTQLKNVAEPIRVCTAASRRARHGEARSILSVPIRPAAPLDGRATLRQYGRRKEHEHFVDGVTETCSQFRSLPNSRLFCNRRNTAFTYKGGQAVDRADRPRVKRPLCPWEC